MQQQDVKWHEKHLWNCDLLHLLPLDLLLIQCWRHTAHSSRDPPVWYQSSPLYVLFTCVSDFPSTSKKLCTRCKISEYHSSYKTSSPLLRNQESEYYPILSLLGVWLYPETWKMCHLCSSLFCSWSELRVISGCFSDKIIIFCWLSF